MSGDITGGLEVTQRICNMHVPALISKPQMRTFAATTFLRMNDSELFTSCKDAFCLTTESQMLVCYRSRQERLSFEERQSVIRRVEETFSPVFPIMKKDAPTLSESDLIYMALTAVGLDSTVISECLCISKDSVRMRKYRLRDKLSQEWFSLVFDEPRRASQQEGGPKTPKMTLTDGDTIVLSQKEYSQLMKRSSKPKMTLMEAVRICYKKCFTFTGRACRSEFWWYILYTSMAGFLFGFMNLPFALAGAILGKDPSLIMIVIMFGLDFLAALAIYFPCISASVRRLHDTEHSGHWIWLIIVPTLCMLAVPVTIAILDHNSGGQMFHEGSPEMVISLVSMLSFYMFWVVCAIIVMLLLCKAGTEGPNRYGPDPLAE